MKGKIGWKVMLSLVIAAAMVVPASVSIASLSNNTNGNMSTNSGPGKIVEATIPQETIPIVPRSSPTPPPLEHVAPNADLILYENFSMGFGVFTVDNVTGVGNYSWNMGGYVDYTSPGGAYGNENDWMNATFTINDATCVDTAVLQFDYWGTAGQFDVLINGNLVNTYTAGAKTTADEDITSLLVTGTNTISFHVSGAATRDFHIDNVTISANFTTDIYINGIVGLESNHRYNMNDWNGSIGVNVTNRGSVDMNHIDFHFQLYQEIPPVTVNYQCWDLENCFVKTWDTVSWDGDQLTWYWTEKRSHSPTHSYACHPDNVATYEAYSHDSLILHNPIHIPTMYEGKTVTAAYVTFWHWCKGEYADDGGPVDYGQLFINDGTGSHAVSIKFYDTSNQWQWIDPYYSTDPRDTDGYDPIDISSWIGSDIQLNFTWFADAYQNYEGWYVDDICIVLQLGTSQPLIDQGYVFTDLPAGETKTIWFPLNYADRIQENQTYYFQVYSPVTDCNPDNHHYGHGYADEVNYTLFFGNICDAAIDSLTVADHFEMPHWAEGVDVPITVVVRNNGTLPEDVPVKVAVYHRVTEDLYSNDFESGDISDWSAAYSSFDTTGGIFPEHVTTYDANLGSHALAYFTEGPNTAKYYLNGMNQGVFSPSISTPPSYAEHTWFDFAAKWAMNISAFWDWWFWGPIFHLIPIYYTGLYADTYPFLGDFDAWAPGLEDPNMNAFLFAYPTGALGYTISNDNPIFYDRLNNPGFYNPYHNGMSLFHIDITDWIKHYQDLGYLRGQMSIGWLMSTSSFGNTVAGYNWSGLMVDDVHVYYDYLGAEVWSDVQTVHLNPGESATLHFTWHANDYCEYAIVATIQLGCDMDPNNNRQEATTHIDMTLYQDDYDHVAYDDNTYGLPDDWHVVQECSVCPQDHFWWNGKESMNSYDANVDDSLYINETFDWSTETEVNISFDTWYNIEDGFDYGYVEVSNDSGITWYLMAYFTGNISDWTHVYIDMVPGTGPGATVPPNFFTNEMQVRFRMVSDSGVEMKGWYIDNVVITNATGVVLWHDDMEGRYVGGVFVEDWSELYGWIHMATPAGCHWHNESLFGNGPTAVWFWNGEPRTWHPHYGLYYPNVDEKVILTYDLTKAYYAIMTFAYNYSFANGDYGYVEISTDNGATWTLLKVYGGTYGDGLNSSMQWRTRTIDLSPYAGGDVPVLLRFHFVDNGDGVEDYGWLVDNITIVAKVDHIAPTATATLDPATPDGCNDWYVSPVKVTITGEDNVAVKAIYYSIDGGAWQTYSGPFTVSDDGTHTVQYYAVDEVGNTSPTYSVSFKIDKTAPSASITFPEAGYIYLMGRQLFKNPLGGTFIIGKITFQADASDATSGVAYVHFEVDSFAYDDASSPYEVFWHNFDLLPHKYTLTVTATDNACNTGSADTLDFTHWL